MARHQLAPQLHPLQRGQGLGKERTLDLCLRHVLVAEAVSNADGNRLSKPPPRTGPGLVVAVLRLLHLPWLAATRPWRLQLDWSRQPLRAVAFICSSSAAAGSSSCAAAGSSSSAAGSSGCVARGGSTVDGGIAGCSRALGGRCSTACCCRRLEGHSRVVIGGGACLTGSWHERRLRARPGEGEIARLYKRETMYGDLHGGAQLAHRGALHVAGGTLRGGCPARRRCSAQRCSARRRRLARWCPAQRCPARSRLPRRSSELPLGVQMERRRTAAGKG